MWQWMHSICHIALVVVSNLSPESQRSNFVEPEKAILEVQTVTEYSRQMALMVTAPSAVLILSKCQHPEKARLGRFQLTRTGWISSED